MCHLMAKLTMITYPSSHASAGLSIAPTNPPPQGLARVASFRLVGQTLLGTVEHRRQAWKAEDALELPFAA